MRILTPIASILLTFALAAPLAAQETENVAEEGVIVVLGEGLKDTPSVVAYSSSEIELETIISAPSGRIEDVLSNVAGFQQFRRSDSRSSNPSAQGVTLRALGGNATSRALVLLDGVPIADPFFGYVPLNSINPEQLSSIRVTRGGGSGPFGAGALAGTIELQSADAATLGPFDASLLANNRGATEATASLSQELGAGFGVITGRWDRGQGFLQHPMISVCLPVRARASIVGPSAFVVPRHCPTRSSCRCAPPLFAMIGPCALMARIHQAKDRTQA